MDLSIDTILYLIFAHLLYKQTRPYNVFVAALPISYLTVYTLRFISLPSSLYTVITTHVSACDYNEKTIYLVAGFYFNILLILN